MGFFKNVGITKKFKHRGYYNIGDHILFNNIILECVEDIPTPFSRGHCGKCYLHDHCDMGMSPLCYFRETLDGIWVLRDSFIAKADVLNITYSNIAHDVYACVKELDNNAKNSVGNYMVCNSTTANKIRNIYSHDLDTYMPSMHNASVSINVGEILKQGK